MFCWDVFRDKTISTDVFYLSWKKNETIKIWLIYYANGRNITERKKYDQLVMRTRLPWARAVLPWLIWWLNFMKTLSWVVLYVKNAPSQAVKPVIFFLNKTISIKNTNATQNISSKIIVQFWKRWIMQKKQKFPFQPNITCLFKV